jgi:hypothetical protein
LTRRTGDILLFQVHMTFTFRSKFRSLAQPYRPSINDGCKKCKCGIRKRRPPEPIALILLSVLRLSVLNSLHSGKAKNSFLNKTCLASSSLFLDRRCLNHPGSGQSSTRKRLRLLIRLDTSSYLPSVV